MISIILILGLLFGIGRQYSEVAHEHNKNRIGFGFLGAGIVLVSYILLQVILGFILGLTGLIYKIGNAELIFAGIACLAVAYLIGFFILRAIRKNWEAKSSTNTSLLDK